jgi:hypothetical protein
MKPGSMQLNAVFSTPQAGLTRDRRRVEKIRFGTPLAQNIPSV